MVDCVMAAPLRCGGPTKARRERRKTAWRRICYATHHGRSYERCQLLLHRPLPRVCSQVLSLDKLVPKSACQPHDALLPDYVPCVNRVRHEWPVQEQMPASVGTQLHASEEVQVVVKKCESPSTMDAVQESAFTGQLAVMTTALGFLGVDDIKSFRTVSKEWSRAASDLISCYRSPRDDTSSSATKVQGDSSTTDLCFLESDEMKSMRAVSKEWSRVALNLICHYRFDCESFQASGSTNEYHSVSTQIDQMKHAQMEENKKLKQMIDDAQQQIKLLKEESKAAPEAFTGQLAVMTTALGFLGVDDIKSFRTVSKEWSRAAADLISCYRSPRAVSMEAVHKSPSTKQVASPASVVFLMKHRDWKLKRYMFNRQRCEICERIVCWPDKFLSTVFCGTCFQDAVDSGMLDFRGNFEDKPDNFASFLEDLRSDCGECPPWCTCQLCQ